MKDWCEMQGVLSSVIELSKQSWIGSMIIILAIYIAFYISRKAKSNFFIANRLWLLIARHKTRGDDQFIKDILDVERFNYFFNTSAVSSNQIKRFEAWIRKYELNFRDIKKLKDYFDIERLQIKKIRRRWIWVNSILTLFFYLLFFWLLCFTWLSSNAMLVKMDNYSSWFWLKADQAQEYTVFGNELWKITAQQCVDHKVKAVSVSQPDINAICKLLKDIDQEDIKIIHQNISLQQKFCILFLIICAGIFVCLYRKLLKMMISVDTRKRLYKKLRNYRWHQFN